MREFRLKLELAKANSFAYPRIHIEDIEYDEDDDQHGEYYLESFT